MGLFPDELWKRLDKELEDAPAEQKSMWKMCKVGMREMDEAEDLRGFLRWMARFIQDLERTGDRNAMAAASAFKDILVRSLAES